ncbi:MAG: universal stress protein [Deltaproteobacteria bacterium]|nr:universal stress protein [Deltaproteobacteria bacterium]MBW1986555.1 universal stress protein [Deltaproteobacteria bacterium]MBW2134508.1 universal stress protein [Deltaproteobacteria bacterium]
MLQFSAWLCIMHVIPLVPAVSPAPLPPSAPITPEFDIHLYQPELRAQSAQALDLFVEAHVASELRVKTISVTGDTADQIVRAAETEKCDLIVIACHVRTGWRRFILGSVAERAVRNASCPVLTIQAPTETAGSFGQLINLREL